MTQVLMISVVLLAILVLVNIGVTVLLIMHLRSTPTPSPASPHERDWGADPGGQVIQPEPPSIKASEQVPTLSLTSVNAGPVTEELSTGSWLVAFVSPGCRGCEEDRPHLNSYLKSHAARGERVLVIVAEDHERIGAFVHDYPDAVVAADGRIDGEAAAAFGVTMWPAYAQVLDGRVLATSLEIPGREAVLLS